MTASPLVAWLDDPPADRGVRFAGRGDGWDFWSYPRLAAHTRRLARGLAEAGLGRRPGVAVVARSGPGFVAALFGCWLAGATPAPIAPPFAFDSAERYRRHLAGLLAAARPAMVVTDAELLDEIAATAAGAGVSRTVSVDSLTAAGGGEALAAPRPDPAALALVQFTSGSSGHGRGVRVPFAALEANVGAIHRWLGWTASDPFASWLPVHHDMGLIGGLICPVVRGGDLWLLPPEEFVHHPLRYLRCFGAAGAVLTTTPAFGLDYLVRRLRPEMLEGLDFSGWRGMVVGAERIEPASLERFCALLAPFGFRRSTLLPAYGLAEATLAVTGLPLGEGWSGAGVEPSSLALGRRIDALEAAAGGQVVVGCGRPLDGVSVAVVDDHGRPLPDGAVGEILVGGSSVAAGYLDAGGSPSSTRFTALGLRTADAGFLLGGQLFVLGRLGDSMKVRGRVVFSEDLEVALSAAGVPRHRVAALLGLHRGVPTVVAVFEQPEPSWVQAAAGLSRHAEGARLVVVEAPRGTIARTSSGKPRRQRLWRAFEAGELPGAVVSLGADGPPPAG